MSLKEEFLELLERDRVFRRTVAGLIGYRDIMERFEEHDKKFNDILAELSGLRKDFELLVDRVEVTTGSMGRRWGMDLERTVLKIFKETLEARGIELGKVEKFRFKDVDGKVTGFKGKIIDVDVLIRDDKLYIVEVKSMAEIEHVESLPEKAGHLGKILGRPVEKTLSRRKHR